jgi:hypothetical protein
MNIFSDEAREEMLKARVPCTVHIDILPGVSRRRWWHKYPIDLVLKITIVGVDGKVLKELASFHVVQGDTVDIPGMCSGVEVVDVGSHAVGK